MTAASLSNLVVEVLHNRGDDHRPDWSVGSGFFVGTRLVLTALHNVDGPGELLVRVHGTEEHAAVVILQGEQDIVDLAVLEVSDVAVDVPPLRYGAVDRSAPAVVERCWAVGFPRFKERVHHPKPLRFSAQVDGEIPTGENLDQPLLTLQVRRSPRPLPSSAPRDSEWAGMSGAAVFSGNNILVGVITEHQLPEGESALTVVPTTALDLLPEAEATQWWKLLGVNHQALVRLPGEAASSLAQGEQRNRALLLKRVREIWIDGVLSPSLHRQTLMALHLQDRPDALDNPFRFHVQETNRPPHLLPAGTAIVQVYDQADGGLLILGKPGTGKTTLLLELTRVLLERAEHDQSQRMPVVFHLSSWAENCLPLSEWLIEELRTKYKVSRTIGKAWIDTDQILPLLDGLDEVAEPVRLNCVQAINAYSTQHQDKGPIPIVVCCRRKDYLALPARVELSHAVSISPLTGEQISDYFQSAGGQLKALHQALQADRKLCVLARYPLMLSIFALAYHEAPTEALPSEGIREAQQRQAFATYVERMLTRRGESQRFSPEQTRRSLTFLATQMQQHHQTVFYLEHLQPSWLTAWQQRLLYRLSVGLVFGLGSGLVFGLVAVLLNLVSQMAGLPGEEVNPLVFGLLVGLSIMLSIGLIFGLSQIRPKERLTRSWRVTRRSVTEGLLSGSGVGLFVGLLFGLFGRPGGPGGGLLVGLGVGLVVGLVGMLASGFSANQLDDDRLTPNQGIWGSMQNGLQVGLGSGLLIGLLIGLLVELSGGRVWSLVGVPAVLAGGLAIGLLIGPPAALVLGLGAFLQHFTLRFWLCRADSLLPRNLVAFLDEMADRLLLHKVGGGYMFVHRQLLDYFASLEKQKC